MLKKLLIAFVIGLFILPAASFAAKKAAPHKAKADAKDSEYDPYGNTCKANGKCTFTRKATLPGNIPVEIQIVSLGSYKADVEKVFDYAINDVTRVATLLNDDDPSSDVSKVNANAGVGFVQVSPEFIQILGAAKKCFQWTNGAFDITSTPDIGNFNNIKIKEPMVYVKKPKMKISFKNIVHGYIADLLIKALYNANLNDASAEVGPVIRTIGTSVTGNWRTQIDDAGAGYAKRGMTIDISNISVATVTAGVNAPAVDPRWGSPALPYAKSVAIFSRDAAIGEALASAVFILGPDKGIPLINSLQTIKGIVIDNKGNFIKSSGL